MLKTLAVNTGSNMATLMIKLAITFVMTPVLVHNLGTYDYGLWEMLAAVTGYTGMLSFGIRPAVSRYAAKHRAESDPAGLQGVYSCAFFFLAATALVLFVFFALWAWWFPELLAPEGEPSQRYTLLLLILGAQLLIEFPGYTAESYLEGFQRYYLKNNIMIVNSLIGAVVIIQFITPENGLLLLAGANAIGVSIKYVIFMAILARPALGALRPALRHFSLSRLKELLTFGGKSLIQGIATKIENQTDALVIGAFLGPAMVPFYSIPANLTNNLRTIGWTLTHAFMPLFSDLHSRDEGKQTTRVYLTASKYVVGALLPMAAGLTLVGGPFIELWIGPELAQHADAIIAILAAFTIAPLLDPFSSRYLTALNRHGIFAKVSPVAAVLNLGLSILLVHQMGILGVALGSLVAVGFTVPIYLRTACRSLGVPVTRYLRECILPSLLPTGLMAAAVMAYRSTYGIESYPALLGAIALGGAIYAVLFLVTAVHPSERQLLFGRLPLLSRRV